MNIHEYQAKALLAEHGQPRQGRWHGSIKRTHSIGEVRQLASDMLGMTLARAELLPTSPVSLPRRWAETA